MSRSITSNENEKKQKTAKREEAFNTCWPSTGTKFYLKMSFNWQPKISHL